jgi:hypothetical protein
MRNVIQLEGRVSRSRSKHEGESSAEICDRLDLTRASSQRQLPTDHDYAVSTREYQLDQSSPFTASAAADPALEKQQQKQTRELVPIDGVTPYQSHHRRSCWHLLHSRRPANEPSANIWRRNHPCLDLSASSFAASITHAGSTSRMSFGR